MNETRYVAALDGLRAVAVAMVILFHLDVPGFDAGYIGVDVFFVLSGFLITSLLVGENARSGRISLARFWSRRIRRLMPALVVLLLVTSAVTALTATRSERESARDDLLSTTFYVANWHFIEASDYFNDTGTDSPLEHTWSLAIEEQFYFVWPLTLAGLLALGRRRARAPVVGAVLLAAVSAWLLAARWSPDAVERAYMGTDSRVFEPLIGAVAAMLLARDRVREWVVRYSRVLVAASGAGIAVAFVVIAKAPRSYFTYGALLVTAATGFLLAALWTGGGGRIRRLLELRPVVWVGELSYGIYLWHWPFIVWLDARWRGGSGALSKMAALILTLAVSAVSYYLVERPVRSASATPLLTLRRMAVGVPLLLVAVGGVAVAATHTAAPASGTPVIVLVGDSVPLHLTPYLERAAEDRGWVVISAAKGGCGVSGDHIVHDDGKTLASGDKCRDLVPELQSSTIGRYDPRVVVRWDRFSVADWLAEDGHQVRAGTAEFWSLRRASIDDDVRRLGRNGAVVALVATEPVGVGIESVCWPDDCNDWLERLVARHDDLTKKWNTVMAEYAVAHPETAVYVSITDDVCSEDVAPCDDRIDGVPARPDGRHYDGEGAENAAAALLDELAPLIARAEGSTG